MNALVNEWTRFSQWPLLLNGNANEWDKLVNFQPSDLPMSVRITIHVEFKGELSNLASYFILN